MKQNSVRMQASAACRIIRSAPVPIGQRPFCAARSILPIFNGGNLAFPVCQSISRQQFDQLCSYSAAEPDFVFLGGRAIAGGRGAARGFSCHAVERVSLPANAGMGVDTQALARKMERLAAPYQHALSSLKAAPCPLIGGWVGSLAYEFGYARETKLQGLVPELPLPLVFAGLYLWFASEDLESGNCYLWVHPDFQDRKSTRLNSSHVRISYAVFCLKK